MEQPRPSSDQSFIASDLDLGRSSFWWTQDNLLPPSLQNRPDILHEMETSSSSKRGGKSTVSKDIYVLYQDYSQTTINASFDAADPSHVTLEQSHERPPMPPRKDQLEASFEQFGSRIASAAASAEKSGSTIGDGSPHGFVMELLRPLNCLQPVGNRAYGALVYTNLANASVQQHDEIRAGDIVLFRTAKFSGHKGNLHQKYSQDVGKPGSDHVAIVMDWDGSKKKIRCWEQVSREEAGKGPSGKKKSKVKEEGYRVGDLARGEVRVYRAMGRNWVGWDKN
jgi:myosin tail region-interacting protein MTI1